MINYKELRSLYISKYEKLPRIFRSPGRINIIGEHTDYNDGFVLPAAVDKEIGMLIEANNTDLFNIYAFDQKEEVQFTYDNKRDVKAPWAQYIIGVIDQLKKAGHQITGTDIIFSGNIPIGAGMSSSAALECVTVYAFNELFNLQLDRQQMIRFAQKAENDYAGVNCGIMDQFASIFSKEGHVFKLDCRDLDFEEYPLNITGHQLVLVDSEVKHSLASSEYNIRRNECEEGVAILQKSYPKIKALRDVSLEELKGHKNDLKKNIFLRCKYVVEEIERVNKACSALAENDLEKLGKLLYATHEGLQNEYKVSCKELDYLVDFTRNKEEVLGARMMGGGFGGCTINLVQEANVDIFIAEIQESFEKKFNIKPAVYKVQTAPGTSEITSNIGS